MKIALVSYFYPPDTHYSGVSTYMYQLVNMLINRKHVVEVFAGSEYREGEYEESGVIVHRIKSNDDFAKAVKSKFMERHKKINFDIVEGVDGNAYTRYIKQSLKHMPLVIKLHTPTFILHRLNYDSPTLGMKLRWYLGHIKNFRIPKYYPEFDYKKHDELERQNVLEADEITTPSNELADILKKEWGLPCSKIFNIPNPFIPTKDLLDIKPDTYTNSIVFMGSLERRKGIFDLVNAMEIVLDKNPQLNFYLVGNHSHNYRNTNIKNYILKKLNRHAYQIHITGHLDYEKMAGILSKSDICVIPSHWENFPYVCLEAMSAARGIIGSSAGGMSEMLDNGNAGILIPPKSPRKIADSILRLINDAELRIQLGKNARKRVLQEYNVDKIGKMYEESYMRAIERRKQIFSSNIIN